MNVILVRLMGAHGSVLSNDALTFSADIHLLDGVFGPCTGTNLPMLPLLRQSGLHVSPVQLPRQKISFTSFFEEFLMMSF